jgi:hypothetical protein
MTKPIIAEIRPAARIVGSVLLHAVSNRVTGRRTIRHSRRTVIARAIGGVSNRSAYDCPCDKSSDDGCAPSPTSASPLHGLGNARGGFSDRKRLAERCRIDRAGERSEAARKQG